MRNRISVFGNFYTEDKNVGGQHIRTDNVFRLIEEKYSSHQVIQHDTEQNKLKLIIKLIFESRFSSHIVIFPGIRFLQVILILVLFHFINPNKLTLVAIGGWLPDFIKNNSILKKQLSKFNLIYTQLPSITNNLLSNGLDKSRTLTNFRLHTKYHQFSNIKSGQKFVFLSRICVSKGVFELINAVKRFNGSCTCDFYGPIDPVINDRFFDALEGCSFLRYQGVLDNSDVVDTLINYDCLVFPTKYPGEGFPGVILEALYAGILVLASDWKYNKEILESYKNGIIFQDGMLYEGILNVSTGKFDNEHLGCFNYNTHKQDVYNQFYL